MTGDAFKDCMKALIAMTPRGREVSDKAMEIYWNRLSAQGFHDDDLRAGTNTLIDSHHWRAFPTVAEIIEACSEPRQERLTREHEARKREENKYRNLTPEQILDRGKKSPEMQALALNTSALLSGKIDPSTWCKRQKLGLKDEHLQAEVHRLESRILARQGQEAQRG